MRASYEDMMAEMKTWQNKVKTYWEAKIDACLEKMEACMKELKETEVEVYPDATEAVAEWLEDVNEEMECGHHLGFGGLIQVPLFSHKVLPTAKEIGQRSWWVSLARGGWPIALFLHCTKDIFITGQARTMLQRSLWRMNARDEEMDCTSNTYSIRDQRAACAKIGLNLVCEDTTFLNGLQKFSPEWVFLRK
jgi:hypothetical protein